MNQIYIRSDKGEYHPGETVCGAVYLDIRTPTEAHGVQLSFNGKESVCYDEGADGSKTNLQATHDYVDYSKADLFTQKEPFALGTYCFPFRLQIPLLTPGTFYASGNDPASIWSCCVAYRLRANVLGADAMVVEQEVVVMPVTPEALKENHMTQGHSMEIASGRWFGNWKKVYVTIKPVSNYVRSGECARLKMVLTNQLNSRTCTFSVKLVRTLMLTVPYKYRPSLDGSEDQGTSEGGQPQGSRQLTKQVEGGPFIVRQMVGDLSQHRSVTVTSGGVLDNIMMPLKSVDGKSVIPSVQGKYVQCDYSLEVSLHIGENNVQTVTSPILGVLPVENVQWLSWKALPWMHTAEVKLSQSPGPISPPEQLLESEAFGRLPGFQDT